MESNKSAEDYLETILVLSKSLPVVRSVDAARKRRSDVQQKNRYSIRSIQTMKWPVICLIRRINN